MSSTPNDLIHASSPYLLQHAYNPVKWKEWSEETLELARKEEKLILVSIGYSACHWCHVMERECFEDETVARIMNDHFVCIKVDREERPDIDQVYMLAVQLMTGRGGWPLNCFTLPDGRPFYGGTYFPSEQWKNVLLNIADLWMHEKDKVFDYAERLNEGMQISEIAKPVSDATGNIHDLEKTVDDWIKRSDHKSGGPDRAPKFPLPVNYNFLLHYNHYRKNEEIDKHIRLTLDKMAEGGIYDQVGGGFARYSTDSIWKVPHFEKMLYDNAQLVSLYSRAYLIYKDERYLEVVEQTLDFIKREFTGSHGEFYSALDADSEHVEGKFYVWKNEELKGILKDDYGFFSDVYDLKLGEWEDENIILMRRSKSLGIEENKRLKKLNELLLSEREKRVRPGLDDKALTSWNAMMCSAYLDAYVATGKSDYKQAALKNYQFITDKMLSGNELLHSFRKDKSAIKGFLEDYAFFIKALTDLYQITLEEAYLLQAKSLTEFVMDEFYDETNGLFYFTSKTNSDLIVRKHEINDNVIPSSAAVMAHNLFIIGYYFEIEEYIRIARNSAVTFKPLVTDYPEGYAHWGELMINFMQPFYEVAIGGEDQQETSLRLKQNIYPSVITAGIKKNSAIPWISDKPVTAERILFVCSEKVCQAPVTKVEEAFNLIV